MRDQDRLCIAWLCWAAPAVVGVSSTLAYLLTRDHSFVMLGLICVPFGIVCFIAGIVLVAGAQTGRRNLLTTLLLSNFPLAFICALAGLREDSAHRIVVTVVNSTDHTIDSALATFNDASAEAAKIAPQSTAALRMTVHTESRDEVRLVVAHAGKTETIDLGSYDGDDLFLTEKIEVEVRNEGFSKPRYPR